MEYRGEGVEALVAVLDDMQNSSLILVDKKNKALLRCLAYYDEFRAVLAYCNQNFDYETEKKKAFQRIGDRKILRLPKADKTLVALVSNLLVEFDDGKIDFVSFAGDQFPAATKQESYDSFFISVMEPFKLALVGLVVEGIEGDVPEVSREVEFASEGLKQQTEYLLVAFVESVRAAALSETVRADLLTLLEGFAAALDSRDTLMIRSIWIGLKNLLAQNRLCPKQISITDETLKLYLVLK